MRTDARKIASTSNAQSHKISTTARTTTTTTATATTVCSSRMTTTMSSITATNIISPKSKIRRRFLRFPLPRRLRRPSFRAVRSHAAEQRVEESHREEEVVVIDEYLQARKSVDGALWWGLWNLRSYDGVTSTSTSVCAHLLCRKRFGDGFRLTRSWRLGRHYEPA